MAPSVQLTAEEEEDIAEQEEYERERQENMRENAALLASLGLDAIASPRRAAPDKKPRLSAQELRARREAKARAAALKRNVEPTRRSGRVAAISQKVEEVKDEPEGISRAPHSVQVVYPSIPRQTAPIFTGPEYESSGPQPSQPIPTRGDDGVLIFEEPWRGVFTPNVTPEEMFRGGAFGGAFWCNTYSKITKSPLSASTEISTLPFTLPSDMVSTHLSSPDPIGSINRFGVRAGQSLQEWEKAGWIWGEDPRGWAQWYTKFWAGRRCEDDLRQIKRWVKVAGPTGRFKNSVIKQVVRAGGKEALANEDVGRVVRQTLWQWGYEVTESEWDKVMG